MFKDYMIGWLYGYNGWISEMNGINVTKVKRKKLGILHYQIPLVHRKQKLIEQKEIDKSTYLFQYSLYQAGGSQWGYSWLNKTINQRDLIDMYKEFFSNNHKI